MTVRQTTQWLVVVLSLVVAVCGAALLWPGAGRVFVWLLFVPAVVASLGLVVLRHGRRAQAYGVSREKTGGAMEPSWNGNGDPRALVFSMDVALQNVMQSEADRLKVALGLLRDAVHADTARLLIPATEPGQMRVAALVGTGADEDLSSTWPAGVGLPAAALKSSTTAVVSLQGLDEDTARARLQRLCPYPGWSPRVRQLAAVALSHAGVEDDTRAVVVVERDAGDEYSADELERLETSSAMLGWLVEVVCRLQGVRKRTEELEAELSAVRALATATDAAEVSQRCIAHARLIIPVESAALATYEGEEHGYQIVYAEGIDLPPGTLFPSRGSLAAEVGHRCVVLPACGRARGAVEPIFGDALPYRQPGDGALAIVPLYGGEELAGVMVLQSRVAERYNHEERLLMRSLGNVAGAELVRRRLEHRLRALARTDPLTSLPNRRDFGERMAAALLRADRYGHSVALIMIDVDQFKKVNDRHGHVIGDEVLQGLGQILMAQARDVDVPARLGGEELALLLEHTDATKAFAVADRLRRAVESAQFSSPEGAFNVTISIGVASYPEHARDGLSLVESADAALYEAKQSGRNRIVVFTPAKS